MASFFFGFCIYRVISLTDLSAGFITTKIPKVKKKNFEKKNILLFRNNLAGPVNLVKLAWTSRSQYLFEINFFAFYIQPGQISVKRFFSNDYFSCFEWKYCAVSQNVIFMSVIYLHFSNCKFLIFKASALWADAFYKSKCPSVCLWCVCLSVCPSVHFLRYRLTVFLPPLPVGCPIFLEIRNPWGKVMERSGLIFEHFCLQVV